MAGVRTLAGLGPGPALAGILADQQPCVVRFDRDPFQRLWLCARVGRRVYSAPLRDDEAWALPRGALEPEAAPLARAA